MLTPRAHDVQPKGTGATPTLEARPSLWQCHAQQDLSTPHALGVHGAPSLALTPPRAARQGGGMGPRLHRMPAARPDTL